MKKIIAILSLSWLVHGAQVSLVDEGINANITTKGFHLVSNLVQDFFLDDLVNYPLGDQLVKIPLGKVLLKDLTINVRWTKFTVEPESGYLRGKIGMNLATGRAKSMTIYPGGVFETTCQDVGVNFSSGQEFFATAEIAVNLRNRNFQLQVQEFDIGRDRRDLQINGPGSCDGWKVFRRIKRYFVEKMATLFRGKMLGSIEKRVVKLIPVLEQSMNQIARQSFPVQLKQLPGLPTSTVTLTTEPYRLSLRKGEMRLTMAIGSSVRTHSLSSFSLMPIVQNYGYLTRYATLGVNPEVLNEISEQMFGRGSSFNEIRIDKPEFDFIMEREFLSSVWPELTSFGSTDDRIRLFVKFNRPPRLMLNQKREALNLNLPDFTFRFAVFKEGRWQNYYYLDMKAAIEAKILSKNNWIHVQLTPEHSYSFKGRWDRNYRASNRKMDESELRNLLTAILEVLAKKPIYKTAIPLIDLIDDPLVVGNPEVRPPYLSVDVLEGARY